MAEFRPLSRRSTPDARFDEPHDGVPGHLSLPLKRWLANQILDGTMSGPPVPNIQFLETYQVEARLDPPLDWSKGGQGAISELMRRMDQDEEFMLDTLDYALAVLADLRPYDCVEEAQRLDSMLTSGGSVWEVVGRPSGGLQLSRRSVGPVADAIALVEGPSPRAHHHLLAAWHMLISRNPDASGAHREAVRAVEAVAKPVVLPNDDFATLGKIIKAIYDKPGKWSFTLGESSDVAAMCRLLWTSQLDRHGTDDESVPLSVSLAQADAAVYLAMTLVRYFAGGSFRAT